MGKCINEIISHSGDVEAFIYTGYGLDVCCVFVVMTIHEIHTLFRHLLNSDQRSVSRQWYILAVAHRQTNEAEYKSLKSVSFRPGTILIVNTTFVHYARSVLLVKIRFAHKYR